MSKSPDAFRTISEVAEWLDVPAHVLRFWESKFTQVKPVKRAGGRRYYRPTDMLLLGGIQNLLHDKGLSIKDAQALLREEGIQHVQSLSKPLDGEEEDESPIDAKPASKWVDPAAAEPEAEKPRRPVVDREPLGEEEHAPRKVAPPAPPPYPAGPPKAAPTPAAPGADAQADVAPSVPVETPLPASDTAPAPASTSHEVESPAPAAAAPQASEDVAPAGPVSDDDTPIADSTPSNAFEDMGAAPAAPSPTAAPQSDVAPQTTPAAPTPTRPPVAPAASAGAAPATPAPFPASDVAQPSQPSLSADEPSETAPAELPQSELSADDHPTDAPISAAPQEQAIDQIAMPFDLPDAPAPARDVASQAQAIQQATSPAHAPTSAASAPASSDQQDFFAAPPQHQAAPSPQSEPQSEELPEVSQELGTDEATPESQPMDVAPATEMRAPEVSDDLIAAEDVATEEVAPSFDAPPVDQSVELPTEATPAADTVAENDFSSGTPDETAETEFGATAEQEVTPEETVQVPEPAPSSDPAAEMAAAMATATAALSETPSVEFEPDTPEFASDTTETDITDTDTISADIPDADAENIFAAADEPQDDVIADVETSLDAAAQSPLPESDFTAPDQDLADDMHAEHAAPDVAEATVSDMELGDSSTQPRPRVIEVSDTPTGDIPAGLLQRLSALNALSALQQGELREIATALRGIIASR